MRDTPGGFLWRRPYGRSRWVFPFGGHWCEAHRPKPPRWPGDEQCPTCGRVDNLWWHRHLVNVEFRDSHPQRAESVA